MIGHIASLAKHTHGSNILLPTISAPVNDVHAPHLEKPGQRATMLVHDGVGKLTGTSGRRSAVTAWGSQELYDLTEKVDAVICNILDKEGCNGYERGCPSVIDHASLPERMTPATGPTGAQGPSGAPGDPGKSLEQRMYDALAPVREVEQDGKGSYILRPREHECKALILCGALPPISSIAD